MTAFNRIFTTERLLLRPFQIDDLGTFVAYRSDVEVARYQSWEPTYSMADAESFLDSQIGLVFGALSPMLAAQFLAQFLPVSTDPTLYPGALLLAALFGMLTTLAFAILPLGHAREVPATALFREQGFEARRLPSWPYVLLAVLFMAALAGLAIFTAYDRFIAVFLSAPSFSPSRN